jgi:hypothetical protein
MAGSLIEFGMKTSTGVHGSADIGYLISMITTGDISGTSNINTIEL